MAASADPRASARGADPIDQAFVWHLTARVIARYPTGYDPTTRLTRWHEYSTEVRHVSFSPEVPAVADFPFADGRVVRLAVRHLERKDPRAPRKVTADCLAGISWMFDGQGRTTGGCAVFNEGLTSLPSRISLFSSSEQEVVLEITGQSVVELDDVPGTGTPSFEPARAIADEVFESRAWNEASGDVTAAWDRQTRVPTAFLKPVE